MAKFIKGISSMIQKNFTFISLEKKKSISL